MKLSIILFAIFCLIGCSINNQPDNRFYTEDGRFKVNFPIKPVVNNQILKSTFGNIIFTSCYSKKNEDEKYFASSSVYDYTVKNDEDKILLLEDSRNYILNQLEIDLISERDTIVNDYMGKFFKASADNYYVDILQLIENNRVFQVGIMKNDEQIIADDFNNLINSFEIIKPNNK
ncbi:MAG: hypothetical protein A2033_05740 [Bacteroidetes bacterium GWA2_31_9]|nr:MAG: hypothetical protein A2033_05740 [Bacteroidetes bacterium GWA2_31_9]